MSMPQQRKTDQCAVDVEEGPKDLYCYCERCCYQRSFQGVMKTVFFYGMLCPFLWFYNWWLFLQSVRLDSQYKFSESVVRGHSDEITLVGALDGDSLVGQLVRKHDKERMRFSQYCGWSLLGMAVYAIVVWVMVAVF